MANTEREAKIENLEQDQDLLLVQEYIEDLDRVVTELENLIDEQYLRFILVVKLKRIHDKYKDSILSLTPFDSFREGFIYNLRGKRDLYNKLIGK